MSQVSKLPVLVVGAGAAGLTAALEMAEMGRDVVLVEKEPVIGGRVARFHHYFPKLCPPSCGLEINTRRLERNPRIQVLMNTRVTSAQLDADGWSLTLETAPEYVTDRCTACGACTEVCPATCSDRFNWGLQEVPVIRRPFPNAWPERFILERDLCTEGCHACVDACRYDAINLNAASCAREMKVASVVVATGWRPYPIENLPELGGGRCPDVISNVQLERFASADGPTGGVILRPSTGTPPERVAFVQCAGSRDVKHLPYCSGVCCLASMKHALYVKERLPDAEVTIFYIDRRAPGRNEDFLVRVAETGGVRFVKGKVGKVDERDGVLEVTAEDAEAGKLLHERADLVVLAVGMVPEKEEDPFGLARDDDGFAVSDPARGLFVAGVAHRPADVATSIRDATGAATRAVAVGRRS